MRMVTEKQLVRGKLRNSTLPAEHRRVMGFKRQLGEGGDGVIMVRLKPWRPSWVHSAAVGRRRCWFHMGEQRAA